MASDKVNAIVESIEGLNVLELAVQLDGERALSLRAVMR